MSRDCRLPWGLVLTSALALLAATGCSTIGTPLDSLLGDPLAAGKPPAPAASENGPKYVIGLIGHDGKKERLERPLQEATYVQDALKQSGALKRFGRVKIELYRQGPSGEYQKLEIPFDRGRRGVRPEFDYALHPGDRLMFIEDTSNALDDILDSVTGPLGGLLRR